MAAIWLGAEKPHQGVSTRNQAWHPAPNVCNSTTALGLRAGQHRNRVRSRCSGEQFDNDLGLYYLRARYYNPATGRFLSRDPEDGKPNDPQSLHKYLYASGDPVNRIDPSGRGDLIEVSLDDWSARQNVVLAERALAKRAAYELCVEAFLLNYEALGIGTVGTGGMGLLLGAQARCAALYL
jgi:RHS repeat-associated protein